MQQRLIKAAGLKPWPDLTPKQREIVASRAREHGWGEVCVFGGEIAY